MFKYLFKYWYNVTDTPYIESKINLWSFINIRNFKNKLSKYIYYFILDIKNLKLKKIKIFYTDFKFLSLYTSYIKYYIIINIFFILYYII